MATADYIARAARANGRELFEIVRIGGFGHIEDSDAGATKFATWQPPATYTGYANFKADIVVTGNGPALTVDWGSIRPSDGSSDAGGLEVTIADPDGVLRLRGAYLRAGVPVTGVDDEYDTLITEDLDRTELGIDVTDDAALADDTVYFVNNEAVRSTAGPAANTLTVARAQWGTQAQPHFTGDPLRSAMVQPKGQVVEYLRNFKGLAATDESLRWRGVLSGFRQTADGLAWQISASSLLSLLDVEVMRRQGRFRVTDTAWNHGLLQLVIEKEGESTTFAHSGTDRYIASTGPKGVIYVNGAASDEPSSVSANLASLQHAVRNMAQTEKWKASGPGEDAAQGETIWEVAPTDQSLSDVFFPSEHPFLIALTWILSTTGNGSNTPDANGEAVGVFDVLPEGWGAEVPAELVDVLSFVDLARRIPASCPNFFYGINGKGGFSLRSHLESELLGPFGCHIVMANGVLRLELYAAKPPWLVSGSVAIDHDSILVDTLPVNDPDLSESIHKVVAETGYSWMDERYTDRVESLTRVQSAWAIRGGRAVEFSLNGFASGSTRPVVENIITAFLMRHRQAPPVLNVDLPDQYEHQIDVGDTVSVTSDGLIDLSRGIRGVEDYAYMCSAKRASGGRETLRMLNQNGVTRVANIAPAIKVSAASAVGAVKVGEDAVDFTDVGVYDGFDEDIDWFTAGAVGVGDIIQCLQGDNLAPYVGGGVPSEDVRITSFTAPAGGHWTINVTPNFGAAPVVGDYLVWSPYVTANVTDGQKQFGFFSLNGRISTSDDAAYVYTA